MIFVKSSHRVVLFLSVFLLAASPVVFHITSAQANERAKVKAAALLSMVSEANASLTTLMTKITTAGLDIPVQATTNYRDGCLLATQSIAFFQNGSYDQASRIAVEALQRLHDASLIADPVIPDEPVPFEDAALQLRALNGSLTQAWTYVSRLERSFNSTILVQYNASAFVRAIDDAKAHLAGAQASLGQMAFAAAEQQLAAAKAALVDAGMQLKAWTTAVKVVKLAHFLVLAEQRLTQLRANITAAVVDVAPPVRNASLTALASAEGHLQTAKTYLTNTLVEATIEELEASKADAREAVRCLEAAGVSLLEVTGEPTEATTTHEGLEDAYIT